MTTTHNRGIGTRSGRSNQVSRLGLDTNSRRGINSDAPANTYNRGWSNSGRKGQRNNSRALDGGM